MGTVTVGKSGSSVTARFEASPCLLAARSSVETGSKCNPVRAVSLSFTSTSPVDSKANKGPGLWSCANRRLQELDHCAAELSAALGEALTTIRCAKSLGSGLARQDTTVSDVESDTESDVESQDGDDQPVDLRQSLSTA